MTELKFNSAGRPTNLSTDNAGHNVRELLDYMDGNPYGSELVRATNTLSQIDRCILILYVYNDNNLTKTAKQLHASTQYLKKRLQEIIQRVRDNVDPEKLDEEMDYIHIL